MKKYKYECVCKYHYPFLIANLESDLILKIAFKFYRADVNVNFNLKRAYRISQKSGKYVDCSELNILSLYSYALKISNSQRPKLAGLTVVSDTVSLSVSERGD